jgi:hypothetical protein
MVIVMALDIQSQLLMVLLLPFVACIPGVLEVALSHFKAGHPSTQTSARRLVWHVDEKPRSVRWQ